MCSSRDILLLVEWHRDSQFLIGDILLLLVAEHCNSQLQVFAWVLTALVILL
jgi:hypothetical protein